MGSLYYRGSGSSTAGTAMFLQEPRTDRPKADPTECLLSF